MSHDKTIKVPIENGKNRYGLDVSYFRNLINRELNGSLENFKPDELARVFARAARAADSSVLEEEEFRAKSQENAGCGKCRYYLKHSTQCLHLHDVRAGLSGMCGTFSE